MNLLLFLLFLVLIIIVVLITYLILSTKHNNFSIVKYIPSKDKNNSEVTMNSLQKSTPSPIKSSMDILVIQNGAYKKFPEFTFLSNDINKAYCNKWGYSYKMITHPLDKAPSYWLKVKDVEEHLRYHDAVIYLDLDAIFYDFDVSIESVLTNIETISGRKFDIFIGKDPSPNRLANAGVFLIRNTDFGRSFAGMWYNACFGPKGSLINKCKGWEYDKENDKWSCEKCVWAGNDYEQGILNYLTEVFPDNVSVLDTSFFSNSKPANHSFILHLMGSNYDHRARIFKEIKDKLNV